MLRLFRYEQISSVIKMTIESQRDVLQRTAVQRARALAWMHKFGFTKWQINKSNITTKTIDFFFN